MSKNEENYYKVQRLEKNKKQVTTMGILVIKLASYHLTVSLFLMTIIYLNISEMSNRIYRSLNKIVSSHVIKNGYLQFHFGDLDINYN